MYLQIYICRYICVCICCYVFVTTARQEDTVNGFFDMFVAQRFEADGGRRKEGRGQCGG